MDASGYPVPDVEVAASLGVLAPSVAARFPELRRRVRQGLWTRYGRVVVTHNGPLTAEQAVWVAVLRSPRGVVLAGLTAALRGGLRVPEPARPELLVPAAGPLPHLYGVDVARTRLLEPQDVHPAGQPPRLRLPRAVVDRASRVDRPDDVRALLCAAVQQRLTRSGDLRDVVLRLGPVRHRGLLLRTLGDVDAGAHSVRELQFTRLLRSAGLPRPNQQVVRRRPGGAALPRCLLGPVRAARRGRRAGPPAGEHLVGRRRPDQRARARGPRRMPAADPGLLARRAAGARARPAPSRTGPRRLAPG